MMRSRNIEEADCGRGLRQTGYFMMGSISGLGRRSIRVAVYMAEMINICYDNSTTAGIIANGEKIKRGHQYYSVQGR